MLLLHQAKILCGHATDRTFFCCMKNEIVFTRLDDWED